MDRTRIWGPRYLASRVTSFLRFMVRANPWMLLASLALASWFLSAVLMALQMHPLPYGGLGFFDLSHPWYIPLAVVVTLLLIRKRLAAFVQWVTPSPRFDAVSTGLRPEVLLLASRVVASEATAGLLAFFHKHPTLSLTATDLAGHTRTPSQEVEQALADLVLLGMLEERFVCDLIFYRLTNDLERRAQLDELIAWQERWLEQSKSLARVVGPSLSSNKSEPEGLRFKP